MPTATEIKGELEFNTELMDILEVMKNVAVFEFRSLQRKKKRYVVFSPAIRKFFNMFDAKGISHPFIARGPGRLCVIMITSDEGFMGGLNLQVINAGLSQPGSEEAGLIIVGVRGSQHLKEMGRDFTLFSVKKGRLPEGKAAELEERHKLASTLASYAIQEVKKGAFGQVIVAYPNPVSFMVQRAEVVELLPLSGIDFASSGEEVIIESPLAGIIEYLTEQFVYKRLIEVLEDGKLSEYAARAIHLEESSQELIEKKKQLKFLYFRAYHELIDRSTRELFSAQLIRRNM